jgi:hypothetical protein
VKDIKIDLSPSTPVPEEVDTKPAGHRHGAFTLRAAAKVRASRFGSA